jgi:streptomycin 6-kinase
VPCGQKTGLNRRRDHRPGALQTAMPLSHGLWGSLQEMGGRVSEQVDVETLPGEFIQTITNLFGGVGADWLARLPALVAECEQAWSLRAMAPLQNLSFNYLAPAVRADRSEAILKIGVPNPELTTEIEALSIYAGRGSVRLLEVDRDRGALLLERLRPGTPLWSVADDEEATRIAARVMGQLWRPVPPDHPFPTVQRWARGMDRMRAYFGGSSGPFPRALVEKAEGLFAELVDSMAEPVLLHGDLHHENILSAERQAWLAIDPKGIVGEPAYEVGALLRNLWPQQRLPSPPSQVLGRRAAVLAEELGFDRARLLGWGLAQAVLSAWWCIEDHQDGWERAIWYAERLEEAQRTLA